MSLLAKPAVPSPTTSRSVGMSDPAPQGPTAPGPHRPEGLSFELFRAVLHDPHIPTRRGLTVAAQGITSGRLWDRATTGLREPGAPCPLAARPRSLSGLVPEPFGLG